MMLITQAASLNRLSLSESHTKRDNSPSLPVRRNQLIKLDCPEMEFANSLILAQTCRAEGGEIKPDNYSGSAVIRNGCNNENQQVITCSQLSPLVGVKLNQQITDKEKGSTENATLWGYGFFHHELNQHLAARQDLQLVKNYLQNPHMLNDNANLRNYKNQHIAEQYARTYETFVGQPFGTQRALNWRLIPFSCLLNSCLISSSSEFNASNLSGNPLLLISFTAASSSRGLLNSAGKILSVSPVIKAILCLHSTVAGQSHEIPIWLATSKTFTSYRSVLLLLSAENVYSMIFLPSSLLSIVTQPFGSSLVFLRWRRLISVSIEAAINCPVLSPSSFTNSIPWTISCGIRAAKVCDFALAAFVAITVTPIVRCSTVCTKKDESKRLTCSTLENRLVFNTLILSVCKNSEARKCVTTSRASIHNVNEAYTMEYSHSTQTRPKFQYLFLAVCRSDLSAKPHRESVTAHSEQDARRSLAGQFVLSFAGRLPEVTHG